MRQEQAQPHRQPDRRRAGGLRAARPRPAEAAGGVQEGGTGTRVCVGCPAAGGRLLSLTLLISGGGGGGGSSNSSSSSSRSSSMNIIGIVLILVLVLVSVLVLVLVLVLLLLSLLLLLVVEVVLVVVLIFASDQDNQGIGLLGSWNLRPHSLNQIMPSLRVEGCLKQHVLNGIPGCPYPRPAKTPTQPTHVVNNYVGS